MTGRIPAEVTEAAGSQVRWPLALTGLGQAIPLARATAEAAAALSRPKAWQASARPG
jgi:hypothetical protein